MNVEQLFGMALDARKKAYAPYSGYRVGAALLAGSGTVYIGANIENAATPAGCCAERVALYAAVMAGETRFVRLAVAGGMEGTAGGDTCYPCGICRQALAELCGGKLEVIVRSERSPDLNGLLLENLLPYQFNAPQGMKKE